jgi:hypothetical protein
MLKNVKELADLGNLADLIKEDRAVGELEGRCAGDGVKAPSRGRRLAFHEARRQGAAVDLDEQLVGALACGVNRTRVSPPCTGLC